MNPWWEGKPGKVLPKTRRHLVDLIKRRLEAKIAPIVVVRGARQVGKTTAQLQVIDDLLAGGIEPRRILRLQFDELKILSRVSEPISAIVDYFERVILGESLNQAAHAGRPAFLFFDEIQNLSNWAPQLKSIVDASTVQVVVTGSSALRIEAGRDSLAGRINTIEAGTLSLTEIGAFRGIPMPAPFLADSDLEHLASRDFWLALRAHGKAFAEVRDSTFRLFSQRGAYPIAHEQASISWQEIAAQLNETVVRRVIQHDLRMGERGRKRDALLLEEVFRLACRYAGQSPSLPLLARESQRALNANVGAQRVSSYLRFLAGSLLIRLIDPLEIRLKKKRGASKICLADHGLRAAWLQEAIPLDPESLAGDPSVTDLAGHIAESAAGALFCSVSGLHVAHYPERNGGEEPEVDFILSVGGIRVPIEIKYQRRIDPMRHTDGLRAFIERSVNRAGFGILVTQTDDESLTDPRVISMPLSSLMLIR